MASGMKESSVMTLTWSMVMGAKPVARLREGINVMVGVKAAKISVKTYAGMV